MTARVLHRHNLLVMTEHLETVTCPQCAARSNHPLPLNVCVAVLDCPHCTARLVPKSGDCCVFCSYGDVKCPSRQAEVAAAALIPSSYASWRRIHIVASTVIAFIAIAHVVMTSFLYSAWTANAVWFLGTGLALLLVGALNLSHIGIEPCRMPTTRLVRTANWIFVAFGVAAVWAVPEPQAFAVAACFGAQALASESTLPGPV